ncbi:sporulation protein YtxC [Bacillaceae bacterium W0354]
MKETLFLFKDEKDANQFYLYVLAKKFNGQVSTSGREVILSTDRMIKQTKFIELIYPFIIDLFVPRIARQLLQQKYYYEADEIDQIVPFVLSICSVSKTLHSNLSFSLYERLIYYLYEHQLQATIDMDHLYDELFVKEESWQEIVGYGIEEWQFELSFQEKMYEMRQYVFQKEAQLPRIVIHLDDNISFYYEDGQIIREDVLKQYQNTSTAPPFEQYEHSFLVSTLLSIAPERIDVYASNDHMHTLYWLLNIFQEKMNLYPETQFPYKIAE